jgi:hypothetical protein
LIIILFFVVSLCRDVIRSEEEINGTIAWENERMKLWKQSTPDNKKENDKIDQNEISDKNDSSERSNTNSGTEKTLENTVPADTTTVPS